jgi:hypothetical protein
MVLAGGPVACAGELEVVEGVLIYLDNKSGHYQPSAAQLEQFRSHLQQLGVDFSMVRTNSEGEMP